MECAQINVTGGNGTIPSNTVSFPGAYAAVSIVTCFADLPILTHALIERPVRSRLHPLGLPDLRHLSESLGEFKLAYTITLEIRIMEGNRILFLDPHRSCAVRSCVCAVCCVVVNVLVSCLSVGKGRAMC